MRSLVKIFIVSFLIIFIIEPISLSAYNLRHISKKDGLSNSAILSMCQDVDGFLWFGSCDGLNRYDGLSILTYNPTAEANTLSGNLIESIVDTDKGYFWVQTNYGLSRFDRKSQVVDNYDQYISNYRLMTSSICELYFVKEKSVLIYFNEKQRQFREVKLGDIPYEDVLYYKIDDNDILWLYLKNHDVMTWLVVKSDTGDLTFRPQNKFSHPKPMIFCSGEKNMAYYVDSDMDLYEVDMLDNKKIYITNIANAVDKYNDISSIIKHNDDYFIGFKADGLVCLKNTPALKNNYQMQDIGISAGVLCLLNDRYQDIVWIGTDGGGVYAYSNSKYSIRSTSFTNQLHDIKMPVRAMLVDDTGALWVGTKGNGIVRIRDYDMNKSLKSSSMEFYTTSNSALSNNSVYAFAHSRKQIIWIGNDEGLNYYNYNSRRISKLPVNITGDGSSLQYVHSITTVGDSVLWIATMGTGVVKVKLSWNGDTPVAVSAKKYIIGKGRSAQNYFFSSYQHADNTMWFGNRGHGVFRFDPVSDRLVSEPFQNVTKNRTLNDIFCIFEDHENNLWFGTSSGLVKRRFDNKSSVDEVFCTQPDLPNSTIHGILSDNNQNLWVSTNLGIAMFNPKLNSVLAFNQSENDAVVEFSDGAYYKDEKRGLLFFGGINGFVTIRENDYNQERFMPPVVFHGLKVFGEEFNINNFMTESKNKDDIAKLKLSYKQSFFSLTVAAIDHINGENYTYMYNLKGLSDSWIDNGRSNIIHFTNITPGNYVLKVKYLNRESGAESQVYSLRIRITPPWYSMFIAKMLYGLLFAALILAGIRHLTKRSERKRRKMLDRISQTHQHDVYESKLKFFTNIAHEFCTPLTLISGPCERIISYNNADDFVIRYAQLIQRNAERMNDLIQELIEFRRIETGNKQLHVETLNVSDVLSDLINDFNDLGENRNVTYEKQVAPNIIWNCDREALLMVVTNLISNAFKYVDLNGKVAVTIAVKEGRLCITISNTGKGLKHEDIDRIFDRYTILDEFENQGEKVNTRNGLGLAIASNLVKLLGGEINVESIRGEHTSFIIMLPNCETDNNVPVSQNVITAMSAPKELTKSVEIPKYSYDKYKPTVMIVDDEDELLWFMCDIFALEYNVIPVSDSREVSKLMTQMQPNVVICDVMMPYMNGIAITKQIKANPKTAHLPLILISAKHEIQEQIEGLEAGAEMYITKPFDVNYLKTFVKQLIFRKEKLKEYFSSPISAYELTGGKLTHVEHKRFAQQIFDIISDNISNSKLSAQFIAQELGISTRHLYRKVEEMNVQSPADMIRECRLHIAKDLLLNSKFTINEIVFKSGFANSGPFFRAFTEKFGCTPKEFRKNNSIE